MINVPNFNIMIAIYYHCETQIPELTSQILIDALNFILKVNRFKINFNCQLLYIDQIRNPIQ